MVADLGFVVRLWWVVASKRCVWLVGVMVAEALYLRRERRRGRERKKQGRIKNIYLNEVAKKIELLDML